MKINCIPAGPTYEDVHRKFLSSFQTKEMVVWLEDVIMKNATVGCKGLPKVGWIDDVATVLFCLEEACLRSQLDEIWEYPLAPVKVCFI